MASIVGEIKSLHEALGARKVLQTTERCPLAEGDLGDADLPHAGQEEALIKVHHNVHNLGECSPILATLSPGPLIRLLFGLLSVHPGLVNVIVHCKGKGIELARIHCIWPTQSNSTTHSVVRYSVHKS